MLIRLSGLVVVTAMTLWQGTPASADVPMVAVIIDDLGNDLGIMAIAAGNTIGGATSAARNVISGNGNDGVFVSPASSPSWTEYGKKGSALEFDGVDDYIEIPDSLIYGEWTFSGWVFLNNLNKRHTIFGEFNSDSHTKNFIHYSTRSSQHTTRNS